MVMTLFGSTFPSATVRSALGAIAPESLSGELEALRRQVDAILHEVGTVVEGETAPNHPWRPAVNWTDAGDRFVVEVLLPGIDSSSLDIQATQDSVTLKGDRPAPADSPRRRSEFRYGPFQRTLTLGEAIRPEAIEATYHQGILTLALPKRAAVSPTSVAVRLG